MRAEGRLAKHPGVEAVLIHDVDFSALLGAAAPGLGVLLNELGCTKAGG